MQYSSPTGQFIHGFRPRYTTGTRNAPSKEYDGHNVESKEYWCETCDRDFLNMHLLEEHKKQHQKCNIDGCQFIAHPKVVTKHIQMQHSTGLYSKISNLNNPEEIQKWREDRKKKYPTQSNIKKKAAEIKEKITRGEKLGLKADRFAQRNNRSDVKRRHISAFPCERPHRDHKRNIKKVNIMQREHIPRGENRTERKQPPPNVIITAPEESNNLKPFAGIQGLLMDSDEEIPESQETNFLIEDDDSNDETLLETKSDLSVTVCGALTNLMCNYATSDEDEADQSKDDPNTCIKIDSNKTIATKTQPESQTVGCITKEKHDEKGKHHAREDDEAPDEVKNSSQNLNNDTSGNPQLPQKVLTHAPQLRSVRHLNKRFRPKPPSTLLQKLLFREMRQERNMVLQCVRHIVQNNYFDKK